MNEDKGVKALPAKLIERRRAKGLNLGELAKLTGISASHLGRIERGERFPSAFTLSKFAVPLDFTEEELFRLAGFMRQGPAETPARPVVLPQEDSAKVLAVGHKVMLRETPSAWPSPVGTITAIRVWHDMDTLLGGPYRGVPIFDIQGDDWSATNVKLDRLMLWREPPPMPAAPEEVKDDAKTN